MAKTLNLLVKEVLACTLCADQLAHGVRPVVQVNSKARILVAGQAPGSRVHDTGIPFDDPSGERLRDWMGINKDIFYKPEKIALLPMGFCYPGKGKSGDLPPLPICARTWRKQLISMMPNISLTLVIGQYAHAWHLEHVHKNLTETVRAWESYNNNVMPLPHPSPRNNIWLKKNPWFEAEVVPRLKIRVDEALAS